MNNKNESARDTADRQILLSRILNAPRELVFQVWTQPEHVVQWWGPNGFTTTNHSMQVTPGGIWRFTMHGPDGRDYGNKIVFIKVVPPELLVYRQTDDEETELVDHHVTVTFEALGDKTRLTMSMLFRSAEELRHLNEEYGVIEGAHQHFARLEAYLERMG